jgi:N-acetylglucosamine kinase-like BadF-type ATPase
MKLFLGVDGGQSRTTALIGDEDGRVLGAGAGGPCNHAGADEGRQRLALAVSDSVAAACAHAGLDAGAARFAVACFGMSGGPADKRAVLQRILAVETLVVTTDAVTALAGATVGEPGIVIIAGTGSIAFGRNAGGRTARAGGWGYIFGDEGGAFDIARQALRASLRYEEGWGSPTALHSVLLKATAAVDANEALHHFYSDQWPRPRVAGLAPLVDETAMAGDAVAREILHGAAQQLAMLTSSVRGQLWAPGESARVAWIGGVFRCRMLLDRYRYLVELEEGNLAGPPEHGPAVGALLEAYRAAGLAPRLTHLQESNPELK